MPALMANIGTFQTGDLVFTRYPPPPRARQPIHVTLFLDGGDGGPGCVHAGEAHVEIADVGAYAADRDAGGYLHAHTTDTTLRANAAAVAQLFASTLRRTPYGNYPGSQDFQRLRLQVESPRGSRFTGMIRTQSVDQIPFDFPALHRLLKWTFRALSRLPLSENRGVTCAAFVSICQQVARMRTFLEQTGVAEDPRTIQGCLRALNGLVETKESLRQHLDLLGTDPTRNNKPIYRNQSYREHSNRALTTEGRSTLQKAKKDVRWDQVSEEMMTSVKRRAPLSELEQFWLVVQTQMLGIRPWDTQPIQKILSDGFFFDAKYVSSLALAAHIVTLRQWRTTPYEVFE